MAEVALKTGLHHKMTTKGNAMKMYSTMLIGAISTCILAFAMMLGGERNSVSYTVESVADPILTPRIRVANDRADGIEILYALDGSGVFEKLGEVPAMALETFGVTSPGQSIRVRIRAKDTQSVFSTRELVVGPMTDVMLRVKSPICESILAMEELDLARTADAH